MITILPKKAGMLPRVVRKNPVEKRKEWHRLIKDENEEELNPIRPDFHLVFPGGKPDAPDQKNTRRFSQIPKGEEVDHRNIYDKSTIYPSHNIPAIKGKPDKCYNIHAIFL